MKEPEREEQLNDARPQRKKDVQPLWRSQPRAAGLPTACAPRDAGKAKALKARGHALRDRKGRVRAVAAVQSHWLDCRGRGWRAALGGFSWLFSRLRAALAFLSCRGPSARDTMRTFVDRAQKVAYSHT